VAGDRAALIDATAQQPSEGVGSRVRRSAARPGFLTSSSSQDGAPRPTSGSLRPWWKLPPGSRAAAKAMGEPQLKGAP
jgi:hypothetical protein